MSPSLIPIAHLFAVGDLMMDRLVGDFSAADWRHRDAMGHDARWIVGHLAVYRCRVAAWAGRPKSTMDWESAFQRGTNPADVPDFLESSMLLAEFHAAHARMEMGVPTLTDAALQNALSRNLPDGSDTKAEPSVLWYGMRRTTLGNWVCCVDWSGNWALSNFMKWIHVATR